MWSSVIGHAAALGATEVSAGLNHGNATSRCVLEKCGFAEVAILDAYTRFRRPNNPSG